MKPVLTGLRAVQALFVIVELGLSAYVAWAWVQPFDVCDDFDGFCETVQYSLPGLASFLIFDSVWTILTLLVLVLVPIYSTMHPVFMVALDGFAMLLWFSGAVGWAVLVGGLGVPIEDAQIAFAFLIFALFVATFVINLLDTIRGNHRTGATTAPHYNPNVVGAQPNLANQPAGLAPEGGEYKAPGETAPHYDPQNPELAHA